MSSTLCCYVFIHSGIKNRILLQLCSKTLIYCCSLTQTHPAKNGKVKLEMITLISKERNWFHSIKAKCLNLQQCIIFARHEAEPSSTSTSKQHCSTFAIGTRSLRVSDSDNKLFLRRSILSSRSTFRKVFVVLHDLTSMLKYYYTTKSSIL